jgi:hypothetical protein
MTTCQAHGATGFTNLLVTKEKGVIVLNPHVANCCVLQLDEQAATAVHEALGDWLRSLAICDGALRKALTERLR